MKMNYGVSNYDSPAHVSCEYGRWFDMRSSEGGKFFKVDNEAIVRSRLSRALQKRPGINGEKAEWHDQSSSQDASF